MTERAVEGIPAEWMPHMNNLYWAESFRWTPSQVRAERVREMRQLAIVHGAAAEGRDARRKQDERSRR